jgi:glycosyltransferase involved in cell wall biosynthesis
LSRIPTRVVVSERNMLSCEAQNLPDLRMKLMPHLIRLFYPWADGIVAVTYGVAEDLTQAAKIPREDIQVIYNPIVIPRILEMAQIPIKDSWFREGEPPVILAVGRLSKQKDFGVLIQAFAQLRRVRQARLLILGEGEERPALEAQIRQLNLEKEIRLPGFVLNPYPFMSQAGVFVLSSRWEGLPGVIIEALYCGSKIVATDCQGSGPREILAKEQHSQLVPVGDPSALAQAILKALDSDELPQTREIFKPFELDTVVDQYLSVLYGK